MEGGSETKVTGEETGLSTNTKAMFSTIYSAADWIAQRAEASGTPAGLTTANSFAELACNALLIYPSLQKDAGFIAWKLSVTNQEGIPPNRDDSEPVGLQPLAEKDAVTTGKTLTTVKGLMNQRPKALSTNGAQAGSGGKQFSFTTIL